MAGAATTVSLRLLVDKTTSKVVFAEADKPLVDFLFHLMSLPLGTVVKLVSQNNSSMVGSLGNLYGSIQNISDTYLQPNVSKDELLNPQVPYSAHSSNLPLLMAIDDNDEDNDDDDDDSETQKYYICNGCTGYNNRRRYMSDDPTSICPRCNRCITTEMYYVPPPREEEDCGRDEGGGGGFVKGVVTYIMTDDLKVMPHSTISSITIMSQFNIKDFGSLEVKDVHLGFDEGLKILKASLHTESVLTTVFLPK